MTVEEQDAVVGRLVREHAEAKKRLTAFEAEAGRIAQKLSQLAHTLGHQPERVSIDGQSMSIDFPRAGFDSKDLDAERIKSLAHDIRETMTAIQQQSEKLKRLGLA